MTIKTIKQVGLKVDESDDVIRKEDFNKMINDEEQTYNEKINDSKQSVNSAIKGMNIDIITGDNSGLSGGGNVKYGENIDLILKFSQDQFKVDEQDKLSVNKINSNLLDDNSVDGVKLQDNSVTGENIKPGSINGNHIKAESIISDMFTDGCISTHHLEGGITDDKILNKTISSKHFKPNTIKGEKLNESLISNKFSIKIDQDDGDKKLCIAENAIFSSDIGNHTLFVGEQFKENTISTDKIGDNEITNDELGDIFDETLEKKLIKDSYKLCIKDSSIDGRHYIEKSFKSSHLTNNCIDISKIKDYSIEGIKLNKNIVDDSSLELFTNEQGKNIIRIKPKGIKGDNINEDISNDKFALNSIDSNKLNINENTFDVSDKKLKIKYTNTLAKKINKNIVDGDSLEIVENDNTRKIKLKKIYNRHIVDECFITNKHFKTETEYFDVNHNNNAPILFNIPGSKFSDEILQRYNLRDDLNKIFEYYEKNDV